jgi:hypothetical protein
MELKPEEQDVLKEHLDYYKPLIGDARTEKLFQGTVKGIIGAESLVCAKIAAQSPELAASKNGEQRIRLLVSRKASTKRSALNAVTLTRKLRQRALEQLRDEEEVWCIFDGSDLRKPHARKMEGLMRVRKLNGEGYTNGYRTLNVFAIGKKRRGIFYHRLFSSEEQDFKSEPAEVQRALRIVIRATKSLKAEIIHCMDSGFGIAVWGIIWEAGQHLVCRLCHLDRLVEQRTATGEWQTVSLEQAAWYRR